jgi:hypothetical protein
MQPNTAEGESNLTPEDKLNPYYNVKDVARLFRIKEDTARKWFRLKLIENSINPGNKGYLARRTDVMAFGQRRHGSE